MESEPVEIPHENLSDDALAGVLEELSSRDGTDMTSVPERVAALRRQLVAGKLRLFFDPVSESCQILDVSNLPQGLVGSSFDRDKRSESI